MPPSYLPPQAEEGDTRLRGNDEAMRMLAHNYAILDSRECHYN